VFPPVHSFFSVETIPVGGRKALDHGEANQPDPVLGGRSLPFADPCRHDFFNMSVHPRACRSLVNAAAADRVKSLHFLVPFLGTEFFPLMSEFQYSQWQKKYPRIQWIRLDLFTRGGGKTTFRSLVGRNIIDPFDKGRR
jgi:hypothetical protein